MGAYHTLELELGFPFVLEKQCWDAIYLERLDLACDPRQSAEVAAVVMQQVRSIAARCKRAERLHCFRTNRAWRTCA